MLHRLWVPAAGPGLTHPYGLSFFWAILAGVVLFHVAGCRRWWESISLRLPAPVLAGGYATALMFGMALAPLTEKQFIYFQF
jgi:hypothetical protein